MEEQVVCAGCHRTEVWSGPSDTCAVRVLTEGGERRPSEPAPLARGRTALRAARGESGPVVGVCEACGQLLVAPPGSRRVPIPVRVDTRDGPVTVQGTLVRRGDAVIEPDEAEAWLTERLGGRWYDGLGHDLSRLPFFLVLVPVFAGWIFAILFVLTFLAAIWQGPAPAVQGAPGYHESPLRR